MPENAPTRSPSVSPRSPLNGYWALGGADRWLAIALPLLAGLILPAQALVLAHVLHTAIVDSAPPATQWVWASLLLGLYGARAALIWAGDRSAVRAAERAKARLRSDLIHDILERGPEWSRSQSSGLLSTLVIEQIEALDGFLARYYPALVQAAVLPLAFVLVIAPIDALVAVVFAVTVPLIPVFMALVGWGAEAASRAQSATLGRLNGYFADRLRGLVTLKLLGRDQDEIAAVARSSAELKTRTLKVLQIAFLSSAVLEFFAALGVAGVALYVGLGFLGLLPMRVSLLTLETGLFCLLMAPEVYQPMRTLAAHHHDRAAAKAAAVPIEAQLGRGDPLLTPTQGRLADATPAKGAIALRGVSVVDPTGAVILYPCSLAVGDGDQLALLGQSGSGKSTLLEAIAGLRSCTGDVSFGSQGGRSARELILTGQLAMLPQRPKLFAGSIADNIRLANPTATDQAVEEAARLACVSDFADRLQHGLGTVLGENGTGLAGGEVQRIALARVYLRDPRIILLDEPTSHLDAKTEADVLDHLFRFAQGRTLVVATHSMAVAVRAGRRVSVSNGHVFEAETCCTSVLEAAS